MIRKMGYMILVVPVLISLAATFVIYPQIPDIVPTHWNGGAADQDQTSPKYFLILTGLLPLLALFLMKQVPNLNPAHEAFKRHKHAYNAIIGIFILFLIGIHWTVIVNAMGFNLDTDLIIKLIIGALFIISSRFLLRSRFGDSFGIRTPWTNEDEEVWRKTHTAASRLFLAAGIITIAAAFFPGRAAFWLITGSVLVSIIILYVYSFMLYQKYHQER